MKSKPDDSYLSDLTKLFERVTWKPTHRKLITRLAMAPKEIQNAFFDWFFEDEEQRRQRLDEYHARVLMDTEDRARISREIHAALTANPQESDEIIASKIAGYRSGHYGDKYRASINPNWVALERPRP